MHQEVHNVLSRKEVQEIVAAFLGQPADENMLYHITWMTEHLVELVIQPVGKTDLAEHEGLLNVVRDRGWTASLPELRAILEEHARVQEDPDDFPAGKYLIRVAQEEAEEKPWKFEAYFVLDYKEVEALVAEFLGLEEYTTLVDDLGKKNHTWCNDTSHAFVLSEEKDWIHPNHEDELAELRELGKPEYNWHLLACLDEYVKMGRLPAGPCIIEVCW